MLFLSRTLHRLAASSVCRSLVLIGAIFVPAAFGQCAQWDASGNWSLKQSNGYTVYIQLEHSVI